MLTSRVRCLLLKEISLFWMKMFAGFSKDDIVYVDLAFSNLDDIGEVNEVYGRLFPINRPARTIYEAAKLPFGAKVKVQAVAMKSSIE